MKEVVEEYETVIRNFNDVIEKLVKEKEQGGNSQKRGSYKIE